MFARSAWAHDNYDHVPHEVQAFKHGGQDVRNIEYPLLL